MLWAALLPDKLPSDESRRTDAVSGLATWCLQFTPRVAVIEPLSESPAVVMEVEASVRLFGGKRKLVERVRDEVGDLGVRQLSWAPTSLAAVALARAGKSNGFAKPIEQLLDALPVETLTAVAAASRDPGSSRLPDPWATCAGCPRGGLSRRFDAELLGALDQAYGLRPEAHRWVELPDSFSAKFELMARVELAPSDVVRRAAPDAADVGLARRAALRRHRLHAALVARRDARQVRRPGWRDDRAHRATDTRHRAPHATVGRTSCQGRAARPGRRPGAARARRAIAGGAQHHALPRTSAGRRDVSPSSSNASPRDSVRTASCDRSSSRTIASSG